MSRNVKMKNKSQTKYYASITKGRYGSNNTTEDVCFENLQGSTDNQTDYEDNARPKGEKWRSIKKYIKEHWFEVVLGIITTIIIGVMSYFFSNIVFLRESVAVYGYRLDKIEESLKEIDNTTIDKEFFSQEIKLLKLELQSASTKELTSLELRIALLEEQIKDK